MNLPKIYEPQKYETDIYALWEKSGAFTPAPGKAADSFSMTLPPPNANANLHTGHALDFQLKDTIGRYQRMQGKNVLMLPGADHAGFETWVVYEKKLAKEGKSRFDFSREELYRQVWDFVAENKGIMESQVRRLGTSCDWTRFTFTLDDKIISRAYKTFKQMWDEELIYRGKRLVNYCTYHGTSFSDIEVTHSEVQGHLWHIKYPLSDGQGELVVATTRPETMLGDVAVAVHPEDERYASFIGKTVKIPLTNREIPIVLDDMVDPEFGSGAVKITPAHDQNDNDLAARHDLPLIEAIDHEGKMTHDMPADYRGLTTKDARKKIVADLKEQGLLVKTEDYTHNVGHCYKCGTVIEPLLREQWFVSMKPLAEKAIARMDKEGTEFFPAKKSIEIKTYMSEIRDWNISRQIAWGIPIPVFQNLDNPDDWIFDTRVHEETITIGAQTYRRDPDVFDTWWSSGQWPYATLDYPGSDDAKQFYPTDLMETGQDIMRPWVSRMIMLGVYVTGEMPFKQVYLHGMVTDVHGVKMSKSKGNVVNPMDIIEEYGADALRLGLLNGTSAGNNQPLSDAKIIGGRNFCNKLWNMARYTEGVIGPNASSEGAQALTSADHWIISKMNDCADNINKLMSSYRVSEAYETLYRFTRDDLADWYIEASKQDLNGSLLLLCLENTLRMAHPFAPFVTETIWQTLKGTKQDVLMTEPWPKTTEFNADQAKEFEEVKLVISEARYIIKTLSVGKPNMYYKQSEALKTNAKTIARMARLQGVTQVEEGRGMHLTGTASEVWLDIDRATATSYVQKLQDDLEKQVLLITGFKKRLANKSYVDNAPKEVVQQTKDQVTEASAHLKKLEIELAQFETATKSI